ncbi:MAG: TonB-dependent receptor plug domain-containing protein [Acidobacteriota bacterium]|nr:TonB-dependent receptor plug domain-containing protein [Acidobacteriota bacterium]
MSKILFCFFAVILCHFPVFGQNSESRVLSGVTQTQQFELVPNIAVEVRTADEKLKTTTDAEGNFRLEIPREAVSVQFSGKNIEPTTRILAADENTENLQIKIAYKIPPVHATVVIEDATHAPDVETRNRSIYENTLFSRDDQVLQTLNAGINAGQHEGGGKSLEIRRFGFNSDHGGVNGGLKILVDGVQQNHGTQGHGQGYLGSLKSLSPELVQDVSILNGPFSAAYGDFSSLGVVHIRQKESLPQQLTFRLQGGSFNTFRTFLAYSPQIKNVASFVAYEGSRTDGPFENPLNYTRDNLTGNFTYNFDDKQAIGFKFNAGRNLFRSSGQIPLDLVAAGELERFGFVDPDNGGKVFAATGGIYFRKEFVSGAQFKADAFLSRSLFDLWSNFTFFLTDEEFGDEIQQHDSRLQQGANAQFLQPYKLFGNTSLFTVGANFHANQINVGMSPSIDRAPNRKFITPENLANPDILLTSAHANVNNYSAYMQNSANFFNGHLRVETGLRIDTFTFDVNGYELRDGRIDLNGRETSTKLQPKFGLAWSPFETFPTVFYFNYGRGISSQDARGVVRNSDAPKISTTDFYQTGAAYNAKRFSLASSLFLIDRSNEQVYIPDDGSIEFLGPTRSYGFEIRGSARINRFVSLNGGLTQVLNAVYRGTAPREYVDSAPHTVANAGLIFNELRGFNFSVNYRHISNYRLDPLDENIRAAGHDVVDFALSKRLRRWIDFNFAIDNLLNKRYYETQNLFESRARPGDDVISRIHATPSYPFTVSAGVTIRLFAKD